MVLCHQLKSIFQPFRVRTWLPPFRVDGIARDYMPSASRFAVWINGAHVTEDAAVDENDVLTFVPVPEGPVIGFVGLLLLTTGVNLLISYLYARKYDDFGPGKETSPTYGFSGIKNTRVEGLPIQVIYGRMRTGGQIINEFVRSAASPPQTDYHVMIAFGEGPVYRIGNQLVDTDPAFPMRDRDPNFPLLTGVQVNGNSLKNFRDVVAHVRLGGNAPLVVPGFEDVRIDTPTSLALNETTTNQDQNPGGSPNPNLGNGIINPGVTTPTNYKTPAQSDPVWNEFGVTFDLTDDLFDGFVVIVEFPQGLYSFDPTNGNNLPAYFDCMVRYRELGGPPTFTPVTTGGPEGDGWVRLFPFDRISVRKRVTFRKEFYRSFRDPQTFAHPTLSKALLCSGTGFARVVTTPMNLPASWQAAGASISDFTLEGWFRPNDLAQVASTNWLVSHRDATPTNGWLLRFQTQGYGIYGTAIPVPTFIITIGGTNTSYYEDSGLPGTFPLATGPLYRPQDGQWCHLAVTFKNGVLRMYFNANLIQSFNVPLLRSAGQNTRFLFGAALSAGGTYDGRMDEVRILSRQLSGKEIRDRYDGGLGQHGPTETALVGGWHFENLQDYSGKGLTLELQGAGASVGTVDGIVLIAGGNAPKRSRYRVQVLRRNLDSVRSDVVDASTLVGVSGIIDQTYVYPGVPTLSLRLRASEQLQDQAPTITSIVLGRPCPIYNGQTVVNAWTRNLAWVALEVVTNQLYGLGGVYQLTDIDLDTWLLFANYCDEFVYDHKGNQLVGPTPTPPGEWGNLASYSATTVDPATGAVRGSFDILIVGSLPPGFWVVGSFVGVVGINTPAQVPGKVLVDLNTRSYEIAAINTLADTVTVYYDRLAEGQPWLNASTGTTFASAIAPTTVTGTWEGRERRHTFDSCEDLAVRGWDRLVAILSLARARPVRRGKELTVFWDRVRNPVDIVSQSSIEEGSFEVAFGNIKMRDNAYAATILDEDLNYETAPATLEDLTIKNSNAGDVVRRADLGMLRGIVRRSAAMRHMAYLLNVNRLLTMSGQFVQQAESLPYEVGDVLIASHDLFSWATSGRIRDHAAASTTSQTFLDRAVTFIVGPTYRFKLRNVTTGVYQERAVNVAAMGGAGTYPAGTALILQAALTFVPQDEAVWYLSEQGAEKLISITDVKLGQDLRREIRWIEYSPLVYDDEWWEDLVPGGVEGLQNVEDPKPVRNNAMPAQVVNLRASRAPRRTPGATRHALALSWEYEKDDQPNVASVRVWWRTAVDTEWELLTQTQAVEPHVIVQLPLEAQGLGLEIAVQAVGATGAALYPEDCATTPVVVSIVPPGPDAPTAFTAATRHRKVAYSWTLPVNTEGADTSYEARVGGWILGQQLFVSGEGALALGPTELWVSGTLVKPDLLLRAVRAGQYSSASIISAFDPGPVGYRAMQNDQFEDVKWRDHGGVNDWGVSASTTLTNLQVASDGSLEFSGSNLSGSYTAIATTIVVKTPIDKQVRECFIEAFVIAQQRWGTAFGSIPLAPNHPDMQRLTMEGPLYVAPGETPNCTLAIEMALETVPDAGIGPWQAYRPGMYRCTYARFRLVATRPNTAYQITVQQFVTRFRRVPPVNEERTPTREICIEEVLGN